ncbi:TetR/AcrR family transcriptional regulator [Jongsikchunia kroppenstedtii]|uniref:TetR/AcrR family transcriptional regulator n=1 Tax=Jongsikchunia kroppenstedtii TaxID=1121721 RepID=UPI00035F876E|nr:TetR/AcrR family transcriptional regulator [Jongsikchunia kroppenstedtii]
MVNPRATDDDLTAKARIRNAALDLYAEHGEERVSLRAIATAAGVTLGLVQHHYKTKAGLRDSVDQLVVDYFSQTVNSVDPHGNAATVAAARDAAVREMLADNPTVVQYLRRAILDPSERNIHLVDALVELTRHEVAAMRSAGLASTRRPESTQVVDVLMRQLGDLLLQPLVDAAWDRIAHTGDGSKPQVTIAVTD